ncbi:MAG TPA: helix-turn-helix transcriptional regulator [Gemmatimonadaceae bacterium]|nr:helix-turn-helix transcriptional regulator [Gemmatimonadaceae bacterium]
MRRHILLYGLAGGALVALLRWIEYRYLLVDHAVEVYAGVIAALFALVGLWLGLRLTRGRTRVVVREVTVPVPVEVPVEVRVPTALPFERDPAAIARLGVTPRELEILELIAAGLSTREIAGRIFVSENTVKTHASRLYEKLGARRRTQAVQIGKERRLIP